MTANLTGSRARSGRASRDAPSLVAVALAALVPLLMLLAVVRLPWAGDLGIHAATVQRLRHSLFDPGNPLVDADTPSPYYSPWILALGLLARLTGLGVFVVLRIGALVGLGLLFTGVWRYTRTLSAHRAAPALALLCLVLLWGPDLLNWSGFVGLNSLALTVAYPSVFALGLSFHFWAWLTTTLHASPSRARWAGLGALWALILLCHQFTGVVATLGALATVLAARPDRRVIPRLAAALAVGIVLLWLWPYYDFFALFSAGTGLEAIHRSLYSDLPGRFGLALLGVVALVLRGRRDHRDPLVLFFVLGALLFAAGGLTGHYSWGRAAPAALIPAQLAAALETVSGGRRAFRLGWAGLLAAALAVGAWGQAGMLGYVVPRDALPAPVAAKYRPPWVGYHWITPWVGYGQVVMARTVPSRQIPAYGPYTVAPGYPDVFLPDQGGRDAAVERYFDAGTSSGTRRAIARRYGVRWVIGPAADAEPWLRPVTTGPSGQVLYEVRG